MRRLIFFFLTAILVTSTACAADSNKYRYLYIEAVRQQSMGNYAQAMEMFRMCHELNPEAPETNMSLGEFYMALGQDSIGISYLKAAVEKEPDNATYAETLAKSYLRLNDVKSATATYEKIVKQHPDRIDVLTMLARIYEATNDYNNLIDVYDRLELQEGQSEDITLAKMRAYSLKGDNDGAYRELKSLVDAHPNDLNLQVMMGNWLLNNGKKEQALATFKKVLEEEPDNAQGQMSMLDCYRADNKTEEAEALLYEMLVNPKTAPDTRVGMIRDYVKDAEERGGDSLRVMQMFDRVLALPQQTSEMAEMRVAYLTVKNAPADSLKAGWERVLEIKPEYVYARLQLIQLLWRDSIDQHVIDECQKAVEYVPNEPMLYYYLGLAQSINKQYDNALATLNRGAGNISNETSKEVAGDIYALLGDIYQRRNMMKEAFAAYDNCLKYSPNNVMCLNNYAYFLSLENRDLKEAEKMSYRAITAEPTSSTYLDTYAWILFQQERIEEAKVYIDMALENEKDSLNMSGDILEHAGDIYMKLGLQKKALEYWEKALLFDVEDEATLRKKIKKYKK